MRIFSSITNYVLGGLLFGLASWNAVNAEEPIHVAKAEPVLEDTVEDNFHELLFPKDDLLFDMPPLTFDLYPSYSLEKQELIGERFREYMFNLQPYRYGADGELDRPSTSMMIDYAGALVARWEDAYLELDDKPLQRHGGRFLATSLDIYQGLYQFTRIDFDLDFVRDYLRFTRITEEVEQVKLPRFKEKETLPSLKQGDINYLSLAAPFKLTFKALDEGVDKLFSLNGFGRVSARVGTGIVNKASFRILKHESKKGYVFLLEAIYEHE